jgi:catechol 2,3-dioxygenase-like lactoylglutathione lyase family enzyme
MADSKPDLSLDHIAVWTGDLEGASKFLTDIVGWKRHPMEFGVSSEDQTTGGMQGVFFDGNGLWLELILPTSPGPGMDILNEKGSGAIIEINFEPADYDATLARMKAKGIAMENMDGSPLLEDGGTIKEGVGKGDDIDEQGQRIAYWPKSLTGGTTVEIFEMSPDDDQALLTIRDNMWKAEKDSPTGPRIDHIAIFVEDLEQAASFYTDVMGLRRNPMKIEIDGDANAKVGGLKLAFIDANGVWLELVQPTGPGPIMDVLKQQGNGHLAELVIEVDDMEKYYDEMKAKGVQMVYADGTPIPDSEKCFVLNPYGIKAAYFPKDVSHGMTIEVTQRGPRETCLLHKRDAGWS